MQERLRVGVFGATSWRGLELVAILARHPFVDIAFATCDEQYGKRLTDVQPQLPPIVLVKSDERTLPDIDVAFLALDHATAAPIAKQAIATGARVIDLSADFRLKDVAEYCGWYGNDHLAPGLLEEAVYGLTEANRADIKEARLVACPGSYATGVLLALQPILKANALNGTIVADCKSSVSGAGQFPKTSVEYMELVDNFVPYKIGRNHRHLPEMEQFMTHFLDTPPSIIFSPHLMPVPRGILNTVYIPVTHDQTARTVRDLYDAMYGDEPFVDILPEGELATLAHVLRSNRCTMGLTFTRNAVIVTAAIDNLWKGAGGQAVQNMNVMFGFGEREGLV